MIQHYVIAPELFATGYAEGDSPCACDATCCETGAYVDLAERDRLLAHAELIKAHMDSTQTQDERAWFEAEEKVDPDYASGRCIGTAMVNGKCAFLDQRGWCTTQVAASAAGMHKWALKPLYCVLFPIEIVGGVVRFDRRMQGRRACCSVQPKFEVPLFVACRDELVHLIGDGGFAELEHEYAARRGDQNSRQSAGTSARAKE
jgi:Fe-S-cluster containining protein